MGFIVDTENELITYSGDDERMYTLVEFYNCIQEWASTPEGVAYPIPVVWGGTPYLLDLINGYDLDESAAKHITGGSIAVRNEKGEIMSVWFSHMEWTLKE